MSVDLALKCSAGYAGPRRGALAQVVSIFFHSVEMLVLALRVSSSSERKVLSSFKNCLIRVIYFEEGCKKPGRSPIRMLLLFQIILF